MSVSNFPLIKLINITTIIFFKKNYVFIILKINTLVNAFFANQFILSKKMKSRLNKSYFLYFLNPSKSQLAKACLLLLTSSRF